MKKRQLQGLPCREAPLPASPSAAQWGLMTHEPLHAKTMACDCLARIATCTKRASLGPHLLALLPLRRLAVTTLRERPVFLRLRRQASISIRERPVLLRLHKVAEHFRINLEFLGEPVVVSKSIFACAAAVVCDDCCPTSSAAIVGKCEQGGKQSIQQKVLRKVSGRHGFIVKTTTSVRLRSPLLSFLINDNILGKCFSKWFDFGKGEGTPVLNKCQNIRVAKKITNITVLNNSKTLKS